MSTGTVFLIFLEGLLAFVSPCILPMLPVYFLYLSGESTKEISQDTTESGIDSSKKTPGRRRLVINTTFFILGFTIVFLLLGAASTVIGQALTSHRALLEKSGGVIIILLGIHMTGLIRIPFLNQEHRFSLGKKTVSVLSSLLLGMAFSFGWSPCLGPFLGSALVMAGQSSTLLQGMSLLLVFSLGLAIPFLLASILFEELTFIFVWFKKHMKLVNIVSGSILILLGLMMLIGWFGYYERLFS